MEIRELRYIAEIGRTHHIVQAARNLQISQPALHKTLRKVEQELDSPLFYRKGNELLPTDTGKIVLETAKDVSRRLSVMSDNIAAAKSMKYGSVSIGFPSIIGILFLPEIMLSFHNKYPDIHLKTVEGSSIRLADLTARGELDTAIIMRPRSSGSLSEIPINQNQIVLGIDPSVPIARHPYITLRDLADIPIVTLDQSFVMRQQLDEALQKYNIKTNITVEAASCEFLCEAARLYRIGAVLPRPIMERYYKGELKMIPFKPVMPWDLCLIFPRNTYMSNACKALISHIQDFMLKL